jgi:putative heme-binding domain-containing protein
MIGPPLSVVGDKLNKAQMLDAIFNPSASILMEYETWRVKTKDGDLQEGLKVEDTPDHITLKDSAGKYHDIKVEEIEYQKKLTISLMPEGLPAAMTVKEMADLVAYLSTLKNQ